ncbi:hypothetical protein [Mycolicibacterium fluoranthenivorans]|uniref:Uncharacterized protein n=1 Tax=Mycolicibacterium fluoranthenivorans TaxID=258505 RepID=A0A7X5U1P2_9MYCO|nr:hypothetical protein [Mycolicibacterium fluoranthenivorans]MCV7359706.1 hypothetical protein [Mycolicibacterium fluoranthenivorans]NIH96756.1 hypothetical protein [Mycolicibacterium fluoranthenivorans]
MGRAIGDRAVAAVETVGLAVTAATAAVVADAEAVGVPAAVERVWATAADALFTPAPVSAAELVLSVVTGLVDAALEPFLCPFVAADEVVVAGATSADSDSETADSGPAADSDTPEVVDEGLSVEDVDGFVEAGFGRGLVDVADFVTLTAPLFFFGAPVEVVPFAGADELEAESPAPALLDDPSLVPVSAAATPAPPTTAAPTPRVMAPTPNHFRAWCARR